MTDPLEKPADPGAYVGHEPQRQAETIPGGVGPDDERISAHSTQRQPDAGTEDGELTADDRGQGATGGS